MRYYEIIAETGDSITTAETWEKRNAAFQRQQAKRSKLKAKITTARVTSYRQQRAAADRQAAANDKLRDLQRDLAAQPKA